MTSTNSSRFSNLYKGNLSTQAISQLKSYLRKYFMGKLILPFRAANAIRDREQSWESIAYRFTDHSVVDCEVTYIPWDEPSNWLGHNTLSVKYTYYVPYPVAKFFTNIETYPAFIVNEFVYKV